MLAGEFEPKQTRFGYHHYLCPYYTRSTIKTIKCLKNKLWEVTKQYVRLRDHNTCQKCGKYSPKGHTSHVIPKARGNVYRFNLDNLKLLCYWCHKGWWHACPTESGEWFKKKFPERYKRIQALDKGVVQFKRKDYERMIERVQEMIKEYESTNTQKQV